MGEVEGGPVCATEADRLPVTVVVPTVGRPDLLRACLASVLACRPGPDEVVVVDQSGRDVSGTVARELADPRIRVVTCPGRGIAKATNLGLGAARNDPVLVTHDDCTVATDWIGVAHQLMQAHPAAIITGRVLPLDGVSYVPSTISSTEPRDYTGWATSGVLYPANMASGARAILDFGGFDERPGLMLAAEDNDLCFRWLLAGRQLRYEPMLVVWHHDWRSPDELVRTHITYAHGQGAFYAKHLLAGQRRILPLLRTDLRRGARAVVTGLLLRRPRWRDPYREMVISLIVGIAKGLPEAERLSRAEPRRPLVTRRPPRPRRRGR